MAQLPKLEDTNNAPSAAISIPCFVTLVRKERVKWRGNKEDGKKAIEKGRKIDRIKRGRKHGEQKARIE